jgi:hypothetical protein
MIYRFPLFLMGAASLITGLLAGLSRLGVADLAQASGPWHGPLMVGGFFGTVIGLERAVALRRPWAYLAPLATGLGGLALILGLAELSPWLLLLGSLIFTAGAILVAVRTPALFTALMAGAAMVWVGGNALWLSGASPAAAAPYWMLFLALTIGAERLELSRLMPPVQGRLPLLAIPVLLLALGLAMDMAAAFGLGLALLALWLAAGDLARRMIRQTGLPRYVAAAVMSGYVGLAVSGLLFLIYGWSWGGPILDAQLHAFFLGFVFAMVFGHAPIILPAVLGVEIAFTPRLYLLLGALQAFLVIRLAGDLAGLDVLRRLGGAGGALVIAAFLLTMAGLAIRSRRPALTSQGSSGPRR